jgi:hypothetical protein
MKLIVKLLANYAISLVILASLFLLDKVRTAKTKIARYST